MNTTSLERVYLPLWLCYSLIPIIAGADKFTNLLVDWSKYLPEFATSFIPVSPDVFMMGVGTIEIVAGLAVLTILPRLGAYVVAAWLVLVACAVSLAGFYDIAVRDLAMALGATRSGRSQPCSDNRSLQAALLTPGRRSPLVKVNWIAFSLARPLTGMVLALDSHCHDLTPQTVIRDKCFELLARSCT